MVLSKEAKIDEEEMYVSEELVGKVYRRGRGLLRIPIVLCIQRYIEILQKVNMVANPHCCSSPDREYPGLVELNINNYWVTSFHGTIVGLHALHWVVLHGRHPKEGTQICHACSNCRCWHHAFMGTVSRNMQMKGCKWMVELPSYTVTLMCNHLDGNRCFPPVKDNHLVLVDHHHKLLDQENAREDLDRKRILHIILQMYEMQVAETYPFATMPMYMHITYRVCYVCFKHYDNWGDFARHYRNHSRLDPEGYHDVDSIYWEVQLSMFQETLSLQTVNEWRAEFVEKEREAENEREKERYHERKANGYKRPYSSEKRAAQYDRSLEKKGKTRAPKKVRNWETMEMTVEIPPMRF